MLSDVEEGVIDRKCRDCGETSYYWIEIEHEDGYRDRACYCRFHGDKTLALLQRIYEEEKAANAAYVAQHGIDPNNFCERCGYRKSACRCYHDVLVDGPPCVPAFENGWEPVD